MGLPQFAIAIFDHCLHGHVVCAGHSPMVVVELLTLIVATMSPMLVVVI